MVRILLGFITKPVEVIEELKNRDSWKKSIFPGVVLLGVVALILNAMALALGLFADLFGEFLFETFGISKLPLIGFAYLDFSGFLRGLLHHMAISILGLLVMVNVYHIMQRKLYESRFDHRSLFFNLAVAGSVCWLPLVLIPLVGALVAAIGSLFNFYRIGKSLYPGEKPAYNILPIPFGIVGAFIVNLGVNLIFVLV